MIKRLTIISLATLLGSMVQLNPAEFHRPPPTREPSISKPVVTEQSPAPEPTAEPTAPPVSKPIASKNPKSTLTPRPIPTPAETPDSTPHGMYVEGFGYVEYGGPNHCAIADSEGSIDKMVGYMGDEPEPTATQRAGRKSIIRMMNSQYMIRRKDKLMRNKEGKF